MVGYWDYLRYYLEDTRIVGGLTENEIKQIDKTIRIVNKKINELTNKTNGTIK